MRHRKANLTLIIGYTLALLFLTVALSSCGAMQKVIKKDKSETKSQTETKAVTTTTASNTETTAITRTITEEFRDSLTAPSKSTAITKENKVLAKGDTITGEKDEFEIKEYVNNEGKVVTEIKKLPEHITVPCKRTIIENVNTVKTASVASIKKEDTKMNVEEKKQSYLNEKKRESSLNWTVVICFSFLIACCMFFFIWWIRRRS